jgi:catechol 2,3-dioxygenase-like lactoylglutathione lyase family enzyme
MPGLDVTQIDHVSVIITDVERSRRFYRDLLGLKEIAKPRTFDFVVLWFDLGNQQLHLLLKDQPDPRSPRHFALRVPDAAAARSYFRSLGIRTEETTPIPGADRFFIADPDESRTSLHI